METVSTFPSATQPCVYVSSAPPKMRNLHYSAKNVDLELILMGINDGRWNELIKRVKKRGYDTNKKSLPCFTPSGVFRIRTDWDLLQYSQIVHLDYDLGEGSDIESAIKIRDRVAKSPYCYCAFLSPSFKGVKVLVRVNSNEDLHVTAFEQVKKVFDELAGVKSDSSVRNISRLCFVSSDPELYINKASSVFEVVPVPGTIVIPDLSVMASKDNSVFGWLYNLTMKGTYQGEILHSYGKGRRNNFLFVFACNCNRYGVDKRTTIDFVRQIWIADNMGMTVSEVDHAVDSAYNYTKEFSTFKLPKHLIA